MGKLNRGFNQTALNGSVGAVTYVTSKGVTVAKQKVPQKLNYRKTTSSMRPRMRWMALVRLWQKLNTVGWRPSFQNKTGLQSDFNMFMKANSNVNVYLPKTLVSANCGVVAPVQVTLGGLPTIGGTLTDANKFKSQIGMGGLTIGASTTLATFSQAILENNSDWSNGDQLTVVILNQYMDNTNLPRITPVIFEITLDATDDSSLLGDMIPANILTTYDGTLGIDPEVNGGACFVHSTGEGASYDVSSETLVVRNDILSGYQGDVAFVESVDSYGGFDREAFLIPGPSNS